MGVPGKRHRKRQIPRRKSPAAPPVREQPATKPAEPVKVPQPV